MRLRNVTGSREMVKESPFVIVNPEEKKGKWESPLHIEIGMGKGQFITKLAQQNPDIRYIGIEKYSSVLIRALEKREQVELFNLFFIRYDAEYIEQVFSQGEVDKIYLNFSDPWPKDRHARRRLTSREYLKRYDQILKKDGVVEFKTDNRGLFDFSLLEAKEAGWHIVAHTYDLHNENEMVQGNIMTEYEEKFSGMGHPICKMIIKR